MTIEEFNNYLENNKDISEKFKELQKEATKDVTNKDDIPEILVQVASKVGCELNAEDIKKHIQENSIQELSDDILKDVNGGSSTDDKKEENFLLFFPWWS